MKKLMGIAVAGSLVLAFTYTVQAQRGGGSGPRRGPPQEAFAACDGKSEGDSCSVETPRGTLEGTCGRPPRGEDERLVCMPPRGEGPPSRED